MTRPKVLIIDDERSSRDTLQTQLLREGYRIEQCDQALLGLERARELEPDLVLMDVMMPGLNGFELCRQFKADPVLRRIPVILVTALNRREDLIKGLDSGADEFVNKPVTGAELRARARSMLRIKRQQDELEAEIERREDLTRLVVHDLRTPVATMRMYLDLLQLGPPRSEDVQVLVGQLQRLESLVDELLTTACMEHGQLALRLEETTLGAIVRELAGSPWMAPHFPDGRLRLALPENEPAGSWDINLLSRALENLLSNAKKYGAPDHPVELEVRYGGGLARLEVRDNGPGVPPEYVGLLFEKFAVVPAMGAGRQQMGLGLYFCRLVAQAHGGRLLYEPNRPQGSVFALELPHRVYPASPIG